LDYKVTYPLGEPFFSLNFLGFGIGNSADDEIGDSADDDSLFESWVAYQ
jgi:hypothetical protein